MPIRSKLGSKSNKSKEAENDTKMMIKNKGQIEKNIKKIRKISKLKTHKNETFWFSWKIKLKLLKKKGRGSTNIGNRKEKDDE